MIVDHVEQNRDAAPVGRLDKRLEIFGPAIDRVGSVGVDPVIAPAPPAAEVGDRHDLDRCHAELDEMIELAGGGREDAFRREGADVQFIEHNVVPGPTRPVHAPAISIDGRSSRSAHGRHAAESATPGRERASRPRARSDTGPQRQFPRPRSQRSRRRGVPSGSSSFGSRARGSCARARGPRAESGSRPRRTKGRASSVVCHPCAPFASEEIHAGKRLSAIRVPFSHNQASAWRSRARQLEKAALSRSYCETTSHPRLYQSGERTRTRL